MTEPAGSLVNADRAGALWRSLACCWLLVVLLVGWHQYRFWQAPAIDSNLLALLPQAPEDVQLTEATARIAEAGARQVVVALGAREVEDAERAQAAFLAALPTPAAGQAAGLRPLPMADDWFYQALAYYTPHRRQLLTAAQRRQLEAAPGPVLAETALAALYAPMAGPGSGRWQDDPLGLWPQWWQQQAQAWGLQGGEQGLIDDGELHWAVLRLETTGSAFRLDGLRHLQDTLDRASQVAREAVPGLTLLQAGVPLHAEAAAVQANREINTIGWGSLAAVLLLVWLTFRSLRPIALVALSLLVGCATALSVTVWAFGQIHLLTLIFGASLVGVAEDYGIHWFTSRQSQPSEGRWRLTRHLLPGLLLALATSALAYLALGLPPFPGLRQMALFAVTGLAAAFLTVVCWFPWLDRGAPSTPGFARKLGGSLVRWPRWGQGPRWLTGGVVLVLLLFGISGLWQLRGNDDLRSLQSSPESLIHQQARIDRLLRLPSPAQFFLVTGQDAEQVLQREQALRERLQPLVEQGAIGGYRALGSWIPSRQQQQADQTRVLVAEQQVITTVNQTLGEALPLPADVAAPLDFDHWLASPVSEPFRGLWLGPVGEGVAAVVLLGDVGRAGALPLLARQANGLDGVRWIDRTSDYSHLLRQYRQRMSLLLVLGVVLVAGLMAWRYRRDAWRALMPTLLAIVLTLATLGWLGVPLQLFNVLALLLLLGVGIDYGIFLMEHRGDPSAWLAISVGAASTWLSFGLLALSDTPALHSFGLTLLLGVGAVWLLSPLFRYTGPLAAAAPHPSSEQSQGS